MLPSLTVDPRIVYSVCENNRLIGVGVAKFGRKIMVDDDTLAVSRGVEPMTILRVKRDPGLGATFIGGTLLVSGAVVAISAESAIRARIFQQRKSPRNRLEFSKSGDVVDGVAGEEDAVYCFHLVFYRG